MIGLSGLITPSLDEMVHVAKEMEREGFTIPLLIGGATTSAKHTAVKIAPQYHGPVDPRQGRLAVRRRRRSAEPPRVTGRARPREPDHAGEGARSRSRSAASASLSPMPRRAGAASPSTGPRPPIAVPAFLGTRPLCDFPLSAIVPYIDWSPFFMSWELKGKYPAILADPVVGEEARDLFEKATAMLGSVGPRPFTHGTRGLRVLPGQLRRRRRRRLHRRVADQGAVPVPLPAPAVGTAGADRLPQPGRLRRSRRLGPCRLPRRLRRDRGRRRSSELVAAFKEDHDDYNAIMVEALADRLAEAFAELLHERARRELGLWTRRGPVDGRPDRREVPRHPPGRGLPLLPRPHREGDALEPARRRRSRRASG